MITHVVKEGETLYMIARRYGTTVDAIVRANQLTNPDQLTVDQRLEIPVEAPPGEMPRPRNYVLKTIQPGDTFWLLSQRYGTTMATLEALNPELDPRRLTPGTQIRVPFIPPRAIASYIVQPGDTLWAIARRTGTNVHYLLVLNNLTNPDLLFAGQRIFVPA